jgi:hypothetical protein
MTKAAYVVFLALLFFSMTSIAVHGEDESYWEYPKSGPNGTSVEHAGKAGRFRAYYCKSGDSPEKVILWYAKRIGLPEDHSLILAARNGFSNLENYHINKAGYGHDTDDRKDYTTIIALLSSEHSHVTAVHRPSLEANHDVTISIASLPNGGTSITVIEPVVDANR